MKPKKFSPTPSKRRKKARLPDNIILLASHGSAKVPKQLARFLSPHVDKRILRNFSDFATSSLLKIFPKDKVIMPKYGRLAGDPNRDLESHEFFRFTDFGGIQIWKDSFMRDFEHHTKRWKRQMHAASRQDYFDTIFESLEKALSSKKNKDKPIILLDFHDTGNLILGCDFAHDRLRQELSDFVMPKVVLSNVNGQTCPPKFLEQLKDQFVEHLNIVPEEVILNCHFKGGFVTQYFGGVAKNPRLEALLKKYHRPQSDIYMVQVELNRDLYMDEAHQLIRPEMGRMRSVVKKVVQSVS